MTAIDYQSAPVESAPTFDWRLLLKRIGPLVGFAFVFGLFSVLRPRQFLSPGNLQIMLLQTAVVGTAALGMTMIIISGGIDLSPGSNIALTTVVIASLLVIRPMADAFWQSWGNIVSATLAVLFGISAGAVALVRLGGSRPRHFSSSGSAGVLWWVLSGLAAAAVGYVTAVLGARFLSAGPSLWWTFVAVFGGVATAALVGLVIGGFVIGGFSDVLSGIAGVVSFFVLYVHWGSPLFLSFIVSLIIVAVFVALGRVFLPRVPISPFIVTLGLWGSIRGVAEQVGGNSTVYPPHATWLNDLLVTPTHANAWMILPIGVWMTIVLAILVALALRYTKFGRHIFAIGSNEQTARLCGVNLNWTKLLIYTIAAVFVGIAGVLQFSYLTMGDPTTAFGLELNIIAAVVIGGASLNGGEGSVFGSIIGALMMTAVANGCTKMGWQNSVELMVTGGIIVIAVWLDGLRHQRTG